MLWALSGAKQLSLPGKYLLFVGGGYRTVLELSNAVEAANFDEGAYEKGGGLTIAGMFKSSFPAQARVNTYLFTVNDRATCWGFLLHAPG